MLQRLILCFFLFPFFVPAQSADTVPLLKSFGLAYENDLFYLFAKTDYYYTGGSFFEMNLPFLKKNPVSKILLKLPNGHNESFGISVSNLGYSPTSIKSDSILFGDRPFSATLFLGFNRVSCDSEKQIRLSSELDLGCIGPAAFGYETQKFIHAHTNNPEPHGWQFQVRNDAFINYSARLEKGLLAKKRFIDFIGYGFANAGTIYNNAGLGLKTCIGRMAPYFSPPGFSKRFQCWIFGSGEGKIIVRDATLQGGFLNTKSIYTISPEDIKRSTISFSGGIVLAYKKIRVEFSNTFLSPEFENGRSHGWGHLGFEVIF